MCVNVAQGHRESPRTPRRKSLLRRVSRGSGAAKRREVGARHEADELFEARLRLPAKLLHGLGRVSDELIDLGGAHWTGDPIRTRRTLALDSTKARERLGWAPTWELEEALAAIVEWYGALAAGEDLRAATLAQIERFAQRGIAYRTSSSPSY